MSKDEAFEKCWLSGHRCSSNPLMDKSTAREFWDGAITEMQQPQSPDTCKLGHPRACLRPLVVGPKYGALAEGDPSLVLRLTPKSEVHGDSLTMTSDIEAVQVCGVCAEIRGAVDAVLQSVNEFILEKQLPLEEIRGDAMAKIIMREVERLRNEAGRK